MYIARRTGGGRGVYEIAGATASGLVSADLVGREITFELSPGLVLFSGLVLREQGGKHRIVRDAGEIQIQRQFAAILLLPSPRRDAAGFGSTNQVARTKEYAIERIGFEFVDSSSTSSALVVPGNMELINSNSHISFRIHDRMTEVLFLWEHAELFPAPLNSLLAKHKALVNTGTPIQLVCEQLVSEIQHAAANTWSTIVEISGDPVPAMIWFLNKNAEALGLLPERESDTAAFARKKEFDLALANVVPKRVLGSIMRRRGQPAFRRALISAYGGRCQVTQYSGEPALEAAHIFPYSEGGDYTNDPRNGLLLRADIHVLFDLGLVRVSPESLQVRVMPPLAESSYATLDGAVVGTCATLTPSREALEKKWEMTSPI